MWKATGNYHINIFLVTIIMAEKTTNMALSNRQLLNGQRVRRISGSAMRIATWNVRSLYDAGKIHNLIKEMSRMNINILGISEHRWPGAGRHVADDGSVMYYSGNDEKDHRNGVAVIVEEAIDRCVKSFIPLSDRAMMLQIHASPADINIIQCYAPTVDKDDEAVEKFYKQLEELQKLTKERDVNIIIGDFNAKVGEGPVGSGVGPCVGQYGLGLRNERGERLIQHCQEYNLVIMNTMFKLHPRRLYTWTSPADNADRIIRNQIDYFIINSRYKNTIKCVKTYPGADIGSDHNPIVSKIIVKLKKVQKKKASNLSNMRLLKESDIRLKVEAELKEGLSEVSSEEYSDINALYGKIKDVINNTIHSNLKAEKGCKRKKWMTTEILDLMEERRMNKNNISEYKRVNNQIKKKIREAKESLIKEDCKEIEDFNDNFDVFNVHKKIKQATGLLRRKQYAPILLDKNDNIITSIPEKLNRWYEYVNELFEDVRSQNSNESQEQSGPEILESEVKYAIELMKNGRAPGPDGVFSEVVKLIDDGGIDILVKLFNKIYDTGQIPSEWLRSVFVALPKISNAKRCKDFRTISLMSHILKIFLKVIHLRIYSKCDEHIARTQFGFRKGFGTREALCSMQLLGEKCRDMNVNLYICFIDYEKAFDNVRHDRLMEILKNKGLDSKDLRIIKNLYWNQKAVVKVDGMMTSETSVCRGVRQGCILSPTLFNIYSESIFEDALSDCDKGVIVNGVVINNIRYADDTALIATSIEDLQHLLDKVSESSNRHGLKVNITKTKYMVMSRKPVLGTKLKLGAEEIGRVSRYKYLGYWLNDQWDHAQEIKHRIEVARGCFHKMKKLLVNRDFNLELRVRILRNYIFSVLLYGVESWVLTQDTARRLEAFEMWCYRRILKISWVEKISTEEVLRRIGKEKEVLFNIQKRKLQYLGHFMRGQKYEILQLIIQGKVQGRRSAGRRRHSWMKNLRDWFKCGTASLFRACASKVKIAMMIANLQRGVEP